MKQISITLMVIGVLAFISAGASPFQRMRGHGVSISDRDSTNEHTFSCEGRAEIWSNDYSGYAKSEETRTLGNQPLHIKASRNGGIHVIAYEGPQVNIKVCKSAVAETDARAKSLLENVKIVDGKGEFSVNGPESKYNDVWDRNDGYWTAVILIQAPKNAELSMSAQNGGISLYEFNGKANAETVNGGIHLERSTGKLTVEARNGGVNITDCGGDVRVTVQNGGVHLNLGQQWDGAGLVAHTQNGGVTLEVPRDLRTSVEVSGSRHSNIRCSFNACDNANKDWDNYSNTIRLGGKDSPVVRVSTVNGSVNITERGRKMMEY